MSDPAVSCALRVRWTPKQWQAVTAAVILLSRKDTPRSVRYVTIESVARLGACGRGAARTALEKLQECGMLYCSAVAWGCHPAMYKVQW